ncbi:hypothetical protein BOX15_Mlig003221g1 [Macrostomum lignano]|uniref:Metallophos domain-containing protein n=1 Tax=Macrostomum lignano TaxID=282301 RepID=A0A267E009_9PLAT|nr:hypothetical protein BOX15_Mlig003221g1 [Macrostomum lignano]
MSGSVQLFHSQGSGLINPPTAQQQKLSSGGSQLGRHLKRLIGQRQQRGSKKQRQQQPNHLVMQPQVYVVGSPNIKSPFLRIAHISDTCEVDDKGASSIYEADVLVHCGNLNNYQFSKHFFKDSEFHSQIKAIDAFFAKMPHKYKIFVAGPNEIFDGESREKLQALLPNCIYLQDSSCVIEGVRFYGTPWTVSRRGIDGRGFVKSHAELKTIWSNIPDDVDVFVAPSIPTNSMYEELVARIRPKLFLYGARPDRPSKSDPHSEENCVKFKDNVIFANGHIACAGKRGLFDFYAEAQSSRETRLPKVSPQVASEALQSLPLPRRRYSLLSCIQS